MVLMMTPTPVQKTVSAKGQTSLENGTSFLEMLGGLIAGEGQQVDSNAEGDPTETWIGSFLEELREAGIYLVEDSLKDGITAELIALLPEEWQEDIRKLADGTEVHMADWSHIQQTLIALIAAQSGELIADDENRGLFQQLRQMMATAFPQFMHSNDESLIKGITRHVQQLLNQHPEAKGNAKAFIQLLSDKAEPKLSLPNMVHRPIVIADSTTNQGLNMNSQGQEFGQLMSRTEQAVIHLGEQLPRQVQEQQFMRQLQLILNRAQLAQQQGVSSLSIKLYPEHLGRVDIQLTQIEGSVVARILASSSATREMIEAQLAQLRQAFVQQQIPVERIEVAEQFLGKDKEEQTSEEREKQQTHGQNEEEDEPLLFNDFLDELTFDEEV